MLGNYTVFITYLSEQLEKSSLLCIAKRLLGLDVPSDSLVPSRGRFCFKY